MWSVRIADTAADDIRGIAIWTERRFGARQAISYADTLSRAVDALRVSGPAAARVKARPEIGPGLYTLHVARAGRKGRHFLLFRVSTGGDVGTIDVLRILHDAMDLLALGFE